MSQFIKFNIDADDAIYVPASAIEAVKAAANLVEVYYRGTGETATAGTVDGTDRVSLTVTTAKEHEVAEWLLRNIATNRQTIFDVSSAHADISAVAFDADMTA